MRCDWFELGRSELVVEFNDGGEIGAPSSALFVSPFIQILFTNPSREEHRRLDRFIFTGLGVWFFVDFLFGETD